MTASHYKLDNLCGIVDFNGLQIDGFCCDVKNMKPLNKKWESFGWNVIAVDGHDIKAIMDALDKAEKTKGAPSVLICCTTKGKGVSFMENVCDFHGRAPTQEEAEKALKELA